MRGRSVDFRSETAAVCLSCIESRRQPFLFCQWWQWNLQLGDPLLVQGGLVVPGTDPSVRLVARTKMVKQPLRTQL